MKRLSKNWIRKAVFGCLFVILGLFGVMGLAPVEKVYADPPANGATTTDTSDATNTTDTNDATNTANAQAQGAGTQEVMSCKDSLESLGWWICPTTGKIAEATDWLYNKIEDVLVIDPVEMKDGSPIYEIWKYAKGVTNIVFIILFLVVIYSQVTGVGITNYGVKKILPKLIVVAILMNLSFIVCSLAVDVSNIVGGGLRGLFASVEESVLATMDWSGAADISMAGIYDALAVGTGAAILGGGIAIETGAIWMLIPVVLGAIVAVASGLITIALRQAVVALLIMISPLAIVAYMLPNTEGLFKKWKDLLTRMLVFYPMFSLLFGASQLAGFAIMASAKDVFGLLLGVAVQIFPLFFSWKMMAMSGTFLSTIHGKIQGLAAKPLAVNRAWAESRRQLTRQRTLAGNAYTPSARLMQFMNNRRVAREAEIGEKADEVKTRGLAYHANSHYKFDADGNIVGVTRKGERAYAGQARTMRYKRMIDRHSNNFNEGLGGYANGAMQKARLEQLDEENKNASYDLKFEASRGAAIELENASSFKKDTENAMNAHFDQEARDAGNNKYAFHSGLTEVDMALYNRMKQIMNGKEVGVHFAAADAASMFSAQAQIMRNKFQTYTDLTPATQDVVNRLKELTMRSDSSDYIDPIIAGLRTLNMRGDTDLVGDQIEELLKGKKVKLGTYASQSLANFLMFDVGGKDPYLRRFGKYINLETARMYNEPEDESGMKKRRKREYVTMDEYTNGSYDHNDENEGYYDEDGEWVPDEPKRDAEVLLRGTSFRDMERTAMGNMMKRIRDHSMVDDGNGGKKLDMKKFLKNEERLWNSIMPNVIGDQFSFLSGSEQIMAFSSSLTGMKKGKIDWEGIFGKEIARKLTPEEKKMYAEQAHERTRGFIRGHVPNQVTRSKTDVLAAIEEQYAMVDELKPRIGEDKKVYFDAEALEEFDKKVWKPEDSTDDEDKKKEKYSEFVKRKEGSIRERFQDSLPDNTKKAVARQVKKGYQGDAKERLFRMLDPEGLYDYYFPKGSGVSERSKRERRSREPVEDEELDGPVADSEESVMHDGGGGYADEARIEVARIYREQYTGDNARDVLGFWNAVRDIISNPAIGKEDFAVIVNRLQTQVDGMSGDGAVFSGDAVNLYRAICQEFGWPLT